MEQKDNTGAIFKNDYKKTDTQPAVEWLVEQILTEVQDYEDGDIETESEPFKHEDVNKYHWRVDLSEFVIKAKKMEKEQILRAYDIGSNEGYDLAKIDDIEEGHYMKEPIEYYNETFKSE